MELAESLVLVDLGITFELTFAKETALAFSICKGLSREVRCWLLL
jgi:hypothetical protein